MMRPRVPIDVDECTGKWTTDGLPMVYVPVHFFLNNHHAVAEALGDTAYAQLLYDAGYASAWTWCASEAEVHHLSGEAVFRHYLDHLSKRGWGLFTIRDLDVERARAEIEVAHSVFQIDPEVPSRDYMFTGWFAGAMDQILAARGSSLRSVSRQTRGGLAERPARFEVGLTDAHRGKDVAAE